MSVAHVLLQMFGLVGAPLIACVLIAWAFTGRPWTTRPRCGRCKAALSFPMMNGEATCAACATSISDAAPHAERTRFLVLPLVLGLVFVALAVGALALTAILPTPGRGFAPSASTAALVSAALRDMGGGMPETLEMMARSRRSDDVALEAREGLARALGPLESGTTITTRGAMAVAEIATNPKAANPIDQALLDRLVDGLFPTQLIDKNRLGGDRPLLVATLPMINDMSAALTRVSIVRNVTVDGKPIGLLAFGTPAPEDDARPFLFDINPPIRLDRPLGPGEHVVTVELEQRLYRRFDAARLRDQRWRWRPVELWPEPLATRKHITSATVTIEADGSVRSSATPPN